MRRSGVRLFSPAPKDRGGLAINGLLAFFLSVSIELIVFALEGRLLAAELGVNLTVPAWFVFLHDSQRRNNWLDLRAGRR